MGNWNTNNGTQLKGIKEVKNKVIRFSQGPKWKKREEKKEVLKPKKGFGT